MRYSPESLDAFAQTAALGSFSAAARKLGKSQSTVSEAVARLEIDLGLALFDRSGRQPQLTAAGRTLLIRVEELLNAADRLTRTANRISEGMESRLTLALSDAYHSGPYEALLMEMDKRYPELTFECIEAEHDDVVNLVSQGRADIGLLAAKMDYPPEIGYATLAGQVEFGIYAAPEHALTRLPRVSYEQLAAVRGLRLNTMTGGHSSDDFLAAVRGSHWSSTSHLILLEMAINGFGWTELPCWMAENYAGGRLRQLNVAGWPRRIAVDVVWSRTRSLGQAGNWLLERITED